MALIECPTCKRKLTLGLFPVLRSGARGKWCSDCRPPISNADVRDERRALAYEFLVQKREQLPCNRCGETGGVYWYRKDGQKCDVFKHAEKHAMAVWFVRRMIKPLTPLCDSCAQERDETETKRLQLFKASEAAKVRALKEKDKKKKARHWAIYFFMKQQMKQLKSDDNIFDLIEAKQSQ